jgi:hypothetical protein
MPLPSSTGWGHRCHPFTAPSVRHAWHLATPAPSVTASALVPPPADWHSAPSRRATASTAQWIWPGSKLRALQASVYARSALRSGMELEVSPELRGRRAEAGVGAPRLGRGLDYGCLARAVGLGWKAASNARRAAARAAQSPRAQRRATEQPIPAKPGPRAWPRQRPVPPPGEAALT